MDKMIEVLVPATSANLGPGFDVLGLAISLHNVFKMEETEAGLEIEVVPDNELGLPTDERNLVFNSAQRLFGEVGYKCKGLRIVIDNGVPMGRGLGSSSTAIVGGLLGANEISGAALSKNELFDLAAEIEGHPDNVGPAIFGGFTICYSVDSKFRAVSYRPSEEIKPVLLVPGTMLETKKARGVLPKDVPTADAVFNIARSSLLVSALLTGKTELLKEAMGDKLHQPYRAPLIPGLMDTINAIAGISNTGVALSGAGPSLICLIERSSEKEFCGRVREVLAGTNPGYEIYPVEFDLEGARIRN